MSLRGSAANSFLKPILARARATPEAPFGVFHRDNAWLPCSIGEFLTRAKRCAAGLAAAGVKPGQIVPLVLRDALDAQSAFLGAMLLGAVPSFLPYPNDRHDENLYRRQHRILLARIAPSAVVVFDDLWAYMYHCLEG